MSTIFLPYVNHDSINYLYYFAIMKQKPVSKGDKPFDSVIFTTGIRNNFPNEVDTAYADLLDYTLLYDTCYIPVDEVVYLYSKLGSAATDKLIKSGAVKLYDSHSVVVGMYQIKGNHIIFANSKHNKAQNLNERISMLVKKIPNNTKLLSDDYKKITNHFNNAIKISNFDSVMKKVSKKSYSALNNKKIIEILEEAKNETPPHQDLKYEQIKLNRIVHYHFYNKISKELDCDYLFVPVELERLYEYYKPADLHKDGLNSLFERISYLEDIPDIKSLILNNTLNVDDIIKIRSSKEAKKFRTWISGIFKTEPKPDLREFEKLYHQACTSTPELKKKFNSASGKIVRTVVIKGVSSFVPGSDLVLTAFDHFAEKSLDTLNPLNYTRDKLKKHIENK